MLDLAFEHFSFLEAYSAHTHINMKERCEKRSPTTLLGNLQPQIWGRRKLGDTRIPTAAMARERRYGGDEDGWQRRSCWHLNGADNAAKGRPQLSWATSNRKFGDAESSGTHASQRLP
jgi:hypothetical protein